MKDELKLNNSHHVGKMKVVTNKDHRRCETSLSECTLKIESDKEGGQGPQNWGLQSFKRGNRGKNDMGDPCLAQLKNLEIEGKQDHGL